MLNEALFTSLALTRIDMAARKDDYDMLRP
jgi:hypothetical protein